MKIGNNTIIHQINQEFKLAFIHTRKASIELVKATQDSDFLIRFGWCFGR